MTYMFILKCALKFVLKNIPLLCVCVCVCVCVYIYIYIYISLHTSVSLYAHNLSSKILLQ